MTALTKFLFPPPARRTTGAILHWWEKRRLPYNLAVGAAGLLSIGASLLIGALPPGASMMGFSWIPVLVVGVLANICYLLGPATEILIEKLWGGTVLPTGPALFRMGLTFSVGLVLLPILMSVIGWVIRVVMAVF